MLLPCEFLTIFDFIRVISPLHRALTQPNGSLSGWLSFTCRAVQILLVLHADDNILGIQVLIWWSFCSPCFPMVSTCKASCCPWTSTSCTLLATWKLKREKQSSQNKPLLRQNHLNYYVISHDLHWEFSFSVLTHAARNFCASSLVWETCGSLVGNPT